MIYATLVHIKTGIEYYKNDILITPTHHEKLLWEIFGLPSDIEKLEETFETEIDELVGFTKKEVQSKCDENFKKGLYNFLPAMDYRQNIELRFHK